MIDKEHLEHFRNVIFEACARLEYIEEQCQKTNNLYDEALEYILDEIYKENCREEDNVQSMR